jgi:hypothetical protein
MWSIPPQYAWRSLLKRFSNQMDRLASSSVLTLGQSYTTFEDDDLFAQVPRFSSITHPDVVPHFFTLHFRNPVIEKLFRRHYVTSNRTVLLIAIFIGMVLSLVNMFFTVAESYRLALTSYPPLYYSAFGAMAFIATAALILFLKSKPLAIAAIEPFIAADLLITHALIVFLKIDSIFRFTGFFTIALCFNSLFPVLFRQRFLYALVCTPLISSIAAIVVANKTTLVYDPAAGLPAFAGDLVGTSAYAAVIIASGVTVFVTVHVLKVVWNREWTERTLFLQSMGILSLLFTCLFGGEKGVGGLCVCELSSSFILF